MITSTQPVAPPLALPVRLLISGFQVQVLSGSLLATAQTNSNHTPMFPTLVTWTFAPEWLTPAQAAELMGREYTEDAICTLIDAGALVAEPGDDGPLVEKRSLYEYRQALGEVASYDDAE